jgi:hypothetical protein
MQIESKLDMLVRVRDADPGFVPGLAKLYDIDSQSPDFEKLVDDLNDYCRSVAPVPVSLRDPNTIKPLLDGFRKQREISNQHPTAFFVVFVGGLLFKRITEGTIETTHSYNECAAFSDLTAARKAGMLLDAMGLFVGIRVTRITNEIRKPETISNQLTDFGFGSAEVKQ